MISYSSDRWCNRGLSVWIHLGANGGRLEQFGESEMCLDDDATVNAVANLAQDGIRTLVLGISIGLPPEDACFGGTCFANGQVCVNGQCVNQAPQVLDAMAVAGQTAINGRHHQVDDVAQIQQQLTMVTGSVAPCTYSLDQLLPFADQLRVVVDDNEVMKDVTHTNGWDVVNGLLSCLVQPATDSEMALPMCYRLRAVRFNGFDGGGSKSRVRL